MRWIASASALAAASVASAATWNFDLATGGEDVMWMSPSAVNPAAFAYEGSYEITAVTATVVVVIPVQVDVTNQVPPEFLTGTASVAGPAPLVLIDEFVASPPPPDPAQIAANVRIELDAAGFGVASATDVVLGDVTVNVPPFGEVTVPLQAISFAGTITVDEVLTHPADFNAIVYRAMGLSPEDTIRDRSGRPVHLVPGGTVPPELI